ncbi:hypothetical protein INR49_017537 [Caranx melampygus]|nr:hypothetical protein INR49_017537 [Caranx melampygus]
MFNEGRVCSCHPVGAVLLGDSPLYNPSSRECTCKPGVGGPYCDSCMTGYWEFHKYSCCPCHYTGNCDPIPRNVNVTLGSPKHFCAAEYNLAPDVGADLSVRLSRLPEITPYLLIGSVQGSLLFTSDAPCCTAPAEFSPSSPSVESTISFSLDCSVNDLTSSGSVPELEQLNRNTT